MKNKLICILDYGSGNVKSVFNLLKFIGSNVIISNDSTSIKKATHLILPGVGSYGTSMEKVKQKLPISVLENEVLINKKPFLGICVGMQLLVKKGYEYGEHSGLGWLPGTVEKINVKSHPLPHIGWNNAIIKRESKLFTGLENINDFYFVHSFAVKTKERFILTATEYEIEFCSSIQKDNIYGVQFHPEKSQRAGIKLIQNFLQVS